MNLLAGLFLGIVGFELVLDMLGALDGVNYGGKIHQKGVTNSFDNVTMMLGHGLLDELVMDGEALQHAGFVGPHLAAKADDVREHDGGELARSISG